MGLGEIRLGEMGLGEMGQNRLNSHAAHCWVVTINTLLYWQLQVKNY